MLTYEQKNIGTFCFQWEYLNCKNSLQRNYWKIPKGVVSISHTLQPGFCSQECVPIGTGSLYCFLSAGTTHNTYRAADMYSGGNNFKGFPTLLVLSFKRVRNKSEHHFMFFRLLLV